MEALETVLQTYRKELDSIIEVKSKLLRKTAKQIETSERIKREGASLKAKEEALNLKSKQCKDIENKVSEGRCALLGDRKVLEDEKKEMKKVIDAANLKVRNATIAADQAHKDATARIKKTEDRATTQLDEMEEKMNEAIALMKEAEDEKEATRAKNNNLADQMKRLLNDNETWKRSQKNEKERRKESEEKVNGLERELRRWKLKAESSEKEVNNLRNKLAMSISKAPPTFGANSSRSPSSSLTSKRLPSESPLAFKNRNNMDSSFSFDSNDENGGSAFDTSTDLSVSQYGPKKRIRETEDFDIDVAGCSFIESEDLNRELDDDDYPMPGMPFKSSKSNSNGGVMLGNRITFTKTISKDLNKKSSSPTKNDIVSKSSTSNSTTNHPFFKTPMIPKSNTTAAASSFSTKIDENKRVKDIQDQAKRQLLLQRTLGLSKKGSSTATAIGPRKKIHAYP